MTSRRAFLKTSSSMAAVLATTRARSGKLSPAELEAAHKLSAPDLKALAAHALDAAKSAGASYADIRFTVTRRQTFINTQNPTETTKVAVGVRALAKGAWGFAAHTEWTPERIALLGRKAAAQAHVNAWPRVPPIEFLDHPPVATGQWQTPIKRDPFTVPAQETRALINSALQKIGEMRGGMNIVLTFERQERTFASTEGAFVTQTVYTALGGNPHEDVPPSNVSVGARSRDGQREGWFAVPFFSPQGKGYEVLEEGAILSHLPEWFQTAQALADAKPLDMLGRYEVVFDAAAMAQIVNGTFGAALEYDRVIGYEANAGGTSYLAPPLKVLGTSVAPLAVTINADRNMPGAVGTVGWDDEGVVPQAFPLIKSGVLENYATTREFVGELTAWYQKQKVTPRSLGCSVGESAMTVPLVCTPNLSLQPNATDTSVDALLSGIKNGFAVFGGNVIMDIQQRSGQGAPARIYWVQDGKLGPPVRKASYTFQSADLWKNLIGLGGASTRGTYGMITSKGQPNQVAMHSVQGVAARFKEVRVVPLDRA